MQQSIILSVAVALAQLGGVVGQSSNGFNVFLSQAAGAVTAVSSAKSAEATAPSSSSTLSRSSTPSSTSSTAASSQPSNTQATASPSATSAPAAGGLSTHSRNLIIILVTVFGLLLLGLIIFAICCCRRRSKRGKRGRSATPLGEDEFDTWRKSTPGREYSPVSHQEGVPSLQQQPTVPVVARVPEMHQHPAMRPENPFVPVPPSPRRAVAPNSRIGLTDAAIPGAEPFITPVRQQGRMRRSPNQSVSPARTPYNPDTVEPFITPVRPYDQRMRTSTEDTIGSLYHPNMTQTHNHPQSLTIHPPTSMDHTSRPRRSSNMSEGAAAAIGNPYEDMHVHVLQTDEPSQELRESLQNREPLRRRTGTPPAVPSRSPRRSRFADSAYSSESSGSGNGSGEEWRLAQQTPAHTTPSPPWDARERRHSNSPPQSMGAAPWGAGEMRHSNSPRQSMGTAPYAQRERYYSNSPIQTPAAAPWVEKERRPSISPRQSAYSTPRQSAHNTPRQSMSGPPRRLRVSDLPQENDGWENHRVSQGVGEAL
ncbi:MAG: hypothetical protein M1830_002310 [Pleopsidium flavum]|nr:MAG: hypothetical protein M1830_002310 [Pleopsidium flavum]